MTTTNIYIKDKTLELLNKNNKWKSTYTKYAEQISANLNSYTEAGRSFHVPSPLVCYTSICKILESGVKDFNLRFAGQSVGDIEVTQENGKDSAFLKVKKKSSDFAKRKLGFRNSVSSEDSQDVENWKWKTGKDAKAFRSFYTKIASTKDIPIRSSEHRIESLLLTLFAKKGISDNKELNFIRPVKLGGKYYQLSTPLRASDHEPKISNGHGGGIDILAHITHKNNRTRLAIIELKDENKASEPQSRVMFQALTYATFIAKLLRLGNCGNSWYKLLISNKNPKNIEDLSNKLDLDVITLMPEGNLPDGDLSPILIKELETTLHLYTLYYKVDKNGNPCEFSGTLIDDMKRKI